MLPLGSFNKAENKHYITIRRCQSICGLWRWLVEEDLPLKPGNWSTMPQTHRSQAVITRLCNPVTSTVRLDRRVACALVGLEYSAQKNLSKVGGENQLLRVALYPPQCAWVYPPRELNAPSTAPCV